MDNRGRLLSLDAFRGFDMFFITGGSVLLGAIGLWASGGDANNWLSHQMTHADWFEPHRIYDFIFSTFLFIAGISWPFSLAKRRERGATNAQLVRHIVVRVALLIVCGLFHSNIQARLAGAKWETFRTWSVIGRVGIAWGIAAAIWMFSSVRNSAYIAGGLLIGWWIVLLTIPSPLAPEGVWPLAQRPYSICNWVDTNFLTVAHRQEGGFATLGMPVLCLMGMFVGAYLRKARGKVSGDRIALGIALAGLAALALGFFGTFCLGPLRMPIIKGIFTPTYALVACGGAAIVFALFYWVIDVKGYVAWSYYFRTIGANALAIYMSSKIIKWDDMAKWFLGALPTALGCSELLTAVLVALVALLLRFAVLHFLYRRNINIKV